MWVIASASSVLARRVVRDALGTRQVTVWLAAASPSLAASVTMRPPVQRSMTL